MNKFLESIGFGGWKFNLIAAFVVGVLLAAIVWFIFNKGFDYCELQHKAKDATDQLQISLTNETDRAQHQASADGVFQSYAAGSISLAEKQNDIKQRLYDETEKPDIGLDYIIPIDSLRGINATASAYTPAN